jgi:hypothetical protein
LRKAISNNNISSWTSGQLAINKVWTLGPDALTKVQEKEDADNEKKQAAEMKKAQQQEKENEKFRLAYQKYVRNEGLVADNLKSLITKVKHCDDYPLCLKIADLQQQLKKQKCRLDLFLKLPKSVIQKQ